MRWVMTVLLAIAVTPSCLSAAEAPVIAVAPTCPAVPQTRILNINTSQAISSGQSVVLAVAVDSANAADLVVSGPPGVTWSSLAGHKSEGRDRSVLLWAGRATANAAAGATVQLRFGLVAAGRSVCVLGLRYASFVDGGAAIATDGQALGSAASPATVSGKQNVDGAMAIAAFIFSANTGAVTASGAAIFDGGACNTALDLCLRVAHQGDLAGSVSIGMTPSTASDWMSTLAVLVTPGLFKNGFE